MTQPAPIPTGRSLSSSAPHALLMWLEIFWPFVGLGLGAGILVVLCALGSSIDAVQAVGWAVVPVYVLHQVRGLCSRGACICCMRSAHLRAVPSCAAPASGLNLG